ncbi:MAG: UDP-2,3-diacylglucosamine diphosphatase [candidate division Zixibacteria bacterium]|nr:UDP-2,3-diacylglucosamine diphosphatase [candidate division Zixibacteria bacterium]
MALYIFSDAHLGSAGPEKEAEKVRQIERLFEKVKVDGDRLVILGDLFDFWFEYRHAMPKDHHKVLFLLHDLINRGIRIDYISGNHDFWMDDFFEHHIGVEVHRDIFDLEYNGKKIHFIHGDGLAPADRGYRVLKRILRNPVNIWLYRKLPPDWAIPLAKYVSGSSRDYTARRDHTFAPAYEKYAKDKLSEGYDIVVIGHLHIPVYEKYDRGVYINTGDFINHFSYAKMQDDIILLEFLQE